MKSIIYSRLYLKGSKVCKKLKMRDMCSVFAHREQFIYVELIVDLRAIYTRVCLFAYVKRCVCILVCAHLNIYCTLKGFWPFLDDCTCTRSLFGLETVCN